MTAKEDLISELDAALNLIHKLLREYGLEGFNEYLVIRKPGAAEGFIIRHVASDQGDFPARLEALHREHTVREL